MFKMRYAFFSGVIMSTGGIGFLIPTFLGFLLVVVAAAANILLLRTVYNEGKNDGNNNWVGYV